jgi:hypothetical protein
VVVVIMAMVPAMVISLTRLIAWPRIDAERAIHTTHRATDNTANWTRGVIPLRRAALHASDNALRVNHDWRG